MINQRALEMSNVTEQDYINWCKENKKCKSKTASKKEFFQRIQNGKLGKSKDGKVVKKNKYE